MPDPAPRPRRSRPPLATIAVRILLYLGVAWGTLAVLAQGAVPWGATAVGLVALYVTVPLAVVIVHRGWPFYPGAAFRLLVVRPFWYVQLLLPVAAAAGLLGIAGGLPFGQALAVGRIAVGVVLLVSLLTLLGGYIGSRRLVVRRVDIQVPGLPPEFESFRIAQLSDLHVGPHSSRRFLKRVVTATQALTPDAIAVTGDLVDDRPEDVSIYAGALRGLRAPAGVFMIPGNHDVYAGWDEVERALHDARLGTVLVNDVHVVRRGDAELALVGTGDPAGGRAGTTRVAPDVDRALTSVPREATVVAFAHNPALWPQLAARGVALTLSGHTHWGQFALPWLGWSLASPFLRHAMGAHQERDSLLYISPGTGYWGIPFRLGAAPEITLVTLRRAPAAAATVHPARAVGCRPALATP